MEEIPGDGEWLRVPTGHQPGTHVSPVYSQRKVVWGCQINVSGVVVGDLFQNAPAGDIAIGISTFPGSVSDQKSPYVAIILSLARVQGHGETYFTSNQQLRARRLVELRYYGDNTQLNVSRREENFHIRFTAVSRPAFCRGHPMPFIGHNDHVDRFYWGRDFGYDDDNTSCVAVVAGTHLSGLPELKISKSIEVRTRSAQVVQDLVNACKGFVRYGVFVRSADYFRLGDPLQWNWPRIARRYRDPTTFPSPDCLTRLTSFDNINHYTTVISASVMLDVVPAVLARNWLRANRLPARFFQIEPTNYYDYYVVIEPVQALPELFDGVLDGCFMPGERVQISFVAAVGCDGILGARKKQDNNFWDGRVLAPQFEKQLPPGSFVLKCKRNLKESRLPGAFIPWQDIVPGTMKDGYHGGIPQYLVFLKLPDQSKVARRRFNAVARIAAQPALEEEPVQSGSNVEQDEPQDDIDRRLYAAERLWCNSDDSEAEVAENVPMKGLARLKMLTLRSVLVGNGLYKPFTTDFLEGCSVEDVTNIMGYLDLTCRSKYLDFLSRVPCGLLATSGAAGTGKSFFLARLICLRVKGSDKVLVCCGQHGAVDNVLDKVQSSLQALGIDALVIRTTDQERDLDAARCFIFDDSRSPNSNKTMSPYKRALSPFEWVMKALREVEPNEESVIVARLSTLPDIMTLADLLGQWRHHLSQQSSAKTIEQRLAHQSKRDQLLQDLKRSFCQACMSVVRGADVVGATSYGTLNDSAKYYTKYVATMIAYDEAGAMTEAESLVPIYRPMKLALCGDHHQLGPHVTTAQLKKNGRTVNPAGRQGGYSLMKRLMDNDWPVLVLNQQYRMIPGQFDVCRDIFYRQDDIQYATVLGQARYAHKLEDWAVWRGATPSPTGSILPVFMHIPGTECTRDVDTKSRLNTEMFGTWFDEFSRSFLSAFDEERVNPEDVAVITPYKSMARYAVEFFQSHGYQLALGHIFDDETDEPLSVGTVDAYQGLERRFVVFLMTVTKATGPCFVAQAERLCVALSRHVEALLVVGDMDWKREAGTAYNAGKQFGVDDEPDTQGTQKAYNLQPFKSVMAWFDARGRVVDYKQSSG